MTRYRIKIVCDKETGRTCCFQVERRRFWLVPFLWETVKTSDPYGRCRSYESAMQEIGRSMTERGEVAVKQEFV